MSTRNTKTGPATSTVLMKRKDNGVYWAETIEKVDKGKR